MNKKEPPILRETYTILAPRHQMQNSCKSQGKKERNEATQASNGLMNEFAQSLITTFCIAAISTASSSAVALHCKHDLEPQNPGFVRFTPQSREKTPVVLLGLGKSEQRVIRTIDE